VECLQPATDLMIVRENTECLYLGIEAQVAPGVVTATRVITAEASLRIARAAFAWAQTNGRSQVTAVHKNNVLIQSDGLFLEGCRQAAAEHPEIAYEEALVDSAAMHLVLDPARFQVMVTTNMFGDILSDLAAGLIGGLGLCPSANLGERGALFEPVHGSAPDIAGQGVANPAAAIGCAAMLLAHLGHAQAARRVEGALARALASGRTTRDLGGKLGTMEMAREVAGLMA
jgi:3-isopropylmalate dehydrogenase